MASYPAGHYPGPFRPLRPLPAGLQLLRDFSVRERGRGLQGPLHEGGGLLREAPALRSQHLLPGE